MKEKLKSCSILTISNRDICNGSPKFSFEKEAVRQNDSNLIIGVTRSTLLVGGKKNCTS